MTHERRRRLRTAQRKMLRKVLGSRRKIVAEEDSEALSSVSSVEDGGQCREAGEDNEEDTSSDGEAFI